MASHLGKLQRKVKFQQWKYLIVALLVSIAGISTTLFNFRFSHTPGVLVVESHIPGKPSQSPSMPNFKEILTTLDASRRHAFETRDIGALSKVNEDDSPQALRDYSMMKQIIQEKRDIVFANVIVLSVEIISEFQPDTSEVVLEVCDSVDGNKRLWNITLTKHQDGTWRYSEVMSIPLSMPT